MYGKQQEEVKEGLEQADNDVIPTRPAIYDKPKEVKKYVKNLSFYATLEQLKMLKKFLVDNNIEYRKI